MSRSILFCQPSIPDSLRKIEVTKWKVERLIHDAYKLRAAESYISKLENQQISSEKLVLILDSAIILKNSIIKNQNSLSANQESRLEIQKQLTKLEKRQKRRWRLVAFAVGGLLVWSVVSD